MRPADRIPESPLACSRLHAAIREAFAAPGAASCWRPRGRRGRRRRHGRLRPSSDRPCKRQMRAAGPLLRRLRGQPDRRRAGVQLEARHARAILASNTKLFTTSAALARYGTEGTLGTEVLGRGQPRRGRHLARRPVPARRRRPHLRQPRVHAPLLRPRRHGGGAGRRARARRHRPRHRPRLSATSRASTRSAAARTRATAPRSGSGRSARLSFNRGLANERGTAFQGNPPLFAAARLDAALEARGRAACAGKPRAGSAPAGRRRWSRASSRRRWRGWSSSRTSHPTTSSPRRSLKDLALQARGRGTTAAGARLAAAFARRLGAGPRLVDGSGLSRGDRASPLPGGAPARARCAARRGRTRFPTRCRSRAATARSRPDAQRPGAAAATRRPARSRT